MNYLMAIAIIGVVIFVHELGHLLAAKRTGVPIRIFSLGFGPKLLAWIWKGTEYRLLRLKADLRPQEFACTAISPDTALIDCYPWGGTCRPKTEVRCGYTDLFCYIAFKVFEKNPVVRHYSFQDPVYEDSCVEFFFNPFPAVSPDYINFEVNAAGALLAQIGPNRGDRRPLAAKEAKGLEIWSSWNEREHDLVTGGHWEIVLKIPLALLVHFYGRPFNFPREAKGNFYKCGDRTSRPHYGCWSPVRSPDPDFHRSAYFGTLIFK